MLTNLLSAVLLIASTGANEPALQPGAHLAFRGSVAQLNADHTPGEARKSFDLSWWVVEANDSSVRLYWLINERGQGAWPWPDRFGELVVSSGGRGDDRSTTWPDAEANPPAGSTAAEGLPAGGGPALLYDYGDGQGAIPLAPPFWFADKMPPDGKPIAAGATWTHGGWKYEVIGEQKVEGREAWQIRVSSGYGIKRTVHVDKRSPLVTSASERVFMNKGTEYVLETHLVGVEQLPPERFGKDRAVLAGLIELRQKLDRPQRSPEVQWSPEQLKLLAERVPQLEKTAADGPLARLVAAAVRDVKLQSGRANEVAQLTAKFLGQSVGKFQAPGLSSQPADAKGLTDADLMGNVTVLHFWEYRDEPLVEPYGQVGYLEFLYHRRKDAGVKVVGVAVDGRLSDQATRPAAVTSVRKLRAFMNLSYPLVLDAGDFVKQLGDPRPLGAPLPLFVVVGRDGKIAHYHVGYYEVDRAQGLKALDAAVGAALEKK